MLYLPLSKINSTKSGILIVVFCTLELCTQWAIYYVIDEWMNEWTNDEWKNLRDKTKANK